MNCRRRTALRHASLSALLLCAGAAAAEDAAQFDVLEFRVLGNTVLPARAIESAVYPYLGEQRTFEDVSAAAAALEQAYRTAGYSTVFVDVPEQAVEEGVVRLRVTEAAVGRRRTVGARHFSGPEVEAAVPELAPGQVPHFPTVQQQLAVVNRGSPDLQVTPVLKSGSVPGTVDVELKVQDQLPLNVAVEVNDRYTADTTRTRASLTLGYDAMFGRPHSLSVQYQTAPEDPDEARVIAATYVARAPETGRALAFFVVDSDSDVATVGALSVLGKGRIYGTRYILPVQTGPQLYGSLTLGLDYKDFDETVRVDVDSNVDTPIDYVLGSLAYSGNLSGERWQAGGTLGGRFGVRSRINEADEFADKRYLARPNFFYLVADGQYRRALPRDFALALRASAQASVEPLVSNEQFSIGGAGTVRGYLEAEQLGDVGIAGGFELSSPRIAQTFHESLRELRLLAFAEAGYTALHDPLPGQYRDADLASAGVGLRLVAFDELLLMLDWAYPLVDGDRTAAGDHRIVFSVRYSQ